MIFEKIEVESCITTIGMIMRAMVIYLCIEVYGKEIKGVFKLNCNNFKVNFI